jgi:hypothetical protein
MEGRRSGDGRDSRKAAGEVMESRVGGDLHVVHVEHRLVEMLRKNGREISNDEVGVLEMWEAGGGKDGGARSDVME